MQTIITTEANEKECTFTIQKLVIDKKGNIHASEYETLPMDEQEFEIALFHSSRDWSAFLKYSDSYNVSKSERDLRPRMIQFETFAD